MNIITVNYYPYKLPNIGDILHIIMKEPKDKDIIECYIIDFPHINAIMNISDITTKKRIKNIRSYISSKPTPAEVLSIDSDTNIVMLGKRYLKDDDFKKAEIDFNNKQFLIKMIKKINLINNINNINYLVPKIIHPFLQLLNDVDIYYDHLLDNHTNIDFTIFGEFHKDVETYLIDKFKDKQLKNIKTSFILYHKNNFQILVDFLLSIQHTLQQNNITLTFITSGNYLLSSFGVVDEETYKHNLIIHLIKDSIDKDFHFELN